MPTCPRFLAKALGALILSASFVFTIPVQAILRDGTTSFQPRSGPDSETGGWFINLGITGARASLKPDAPKELVVEYVFSGSPADGALEVGDRITGVNGKAFSEPHRFGYGMDIFGYEGPMMDFGLALEDSQGGALDGVLTLDIVRGDEAQQLSLQLPTEYGQFSETYPYDCPKTDRLLEEMYAYLADQQNERGGFLNGRPHIDAFAALALMASNDKRYRRNVERAMKHFASQLDGEIHFDGGYDCWKYGLFGICLAEYYLLTEEKWVLEALEVINDWLVRAQFAEHYRNDQGAGGWGHRPAGRPGGNGYGPICIITAQALAAWGLIEQCGIEIDAERYRLAHEFLDKATNNIGYVWYKDGNGGDDKYADMGRTGASAMAHAVTISGGRDFERLAKKSATCIGDHPNTFTDTHGSAILGLAWSGLGALADEDSFRALMDYHVWHWNLSHCHDGTFYVQPCRDPNTQDYNAHSRLSATAATALVLSAKHRSLQILGGGPAAPTSTQSQAVVPEPEWHRFFNKEKTRSFEGQFVGFDVDTAVVTARLRNRTVIEFSIDTLSKDDQAWVRKQAGRAPPADQASTPARTEPAAIAGSASPTVRVFILAGQSNMEGHGAITADSGRNDGKGSLEHVVANEATAEAFGKLRPSADEDWAERDDVWIHYLERKGALRAGFGAREDRIGPELGFGWVAGDAIEDPVLLIKLAWGGKSLGVDFLPPSASPDGEAGPYYRELIARTQSLLDDVAAEFPDLKNHRVELAGIGWHQGWNDRVNQELNDVYEENLAHLIRDLRRDLESPDLPFVIAETGMSGVEEKHPRALSLMAAQAAVAESAEFRDSVSFVSTREFYRSPDESPSGQQYHWNSNAETYLLIGEAMGRAMLELLAGVD